MKITYYNSAKYEKTTTENIKAILSMPDADEITEEEKEMFRSGEAIPMCNYADEKGQWKSVPWSFVIEIDE